MGNRVPRIRTNVSETDMANAIIASWQSMFNGQSPSKEQIALILAQNALETNHRKSMYNYNVGNITTNGKGPYNYFDDLTTSEQIKKGVWKKMNLKYRAYPSLQEGMNDYLKFISSGRYASAWEHILHPDPADYSKALKAAGYYTADEKKYTGAVTKLYDSYSKSQSEGGVAQPQQIAKQSPQNNMSKINDILDKYLQLSIAASENINREMCKKLPTNDFVIKVSSNNYTNSIEFSRILCAAIEEEIVGSAYTHTDGKNIEINCSIPGPQKECFNAINQLTNSISSLFKEATNEIGKISIDTECIANKKSLYEYIDFNTADIQYKKFLSKF